MGRRLTEILESDLARRAAERRAAASDDALRRRAARHPAATPELLAAGRDRAVLVLRGRRLQLTPRHSEILVVLCLHPDGLSAEQLALELYGDFGKPVSVRAELSRLRRVLGNRLEANPYRLAPALRTDFAAGGDAPYPGSLLPASDVPAVRELRGRLDAEARAAALHSDDVERLHAWLASASGAHDIEAARRLVSLLPEADVRRPAAVSRLQRLARE